MDTQTNQEIPPKKFWAAHCRGCNYRLLKNQGFLTFYPTVDDYVFLEIKPENQRLTRKQTELGVLFLRDHDKLVEITEDEVMQMADQTVDHLQVGTEIKVLIGRCENLEGKVLEIRPEGKFLVELKGYNRTYTEELAREEMVLKTRTVERSIDVEVDGTDPTAE